jgi:hypothetical protein
MDKSGANYASLANINLLLILAGFATMILLRKSVRLVMQVEKLKFMFMVS